MMPTAANAQKVASAGRREVPRTKAIMSVSEVIVIGHRRPHRLPHPHGHWQLLDALGLERGDEDEHVVDADADQDERQHVDHRVERAPQGDGEAVCHRDRHPDRAQPAIAERTRDLTGWHRVKMKTAYTRMIRNDA